MARFFRGGALPSETFPGNPRGGELPGEKVRKNLRGGGLPCEIFPSGFVGESSPARFSAEISEVRPSPPRFFCWDENPGRLLALGGGRGVLLHGLQVDGDVDVIPEEGAAAVERLVPLDLVFLAVE